MPALYEFERVFTEEGWRGHVCVEVDDSGWISGVHDTRPLHAHPVQVDGFALPGVPNLHSHAFQRALAARTERIGSGESFWTWREGMYRLAAALGPDDLEAIAAQVFVEMLESGYTSVGEFHYLHNDVGGERYADRCEMSARIVGAAHKAGIGLTLLPVLYTASGFGKTATLPEQSRFVLDVDAFAELVAELATRHAGDPEVRIGIAPHSLRAVPAERLRASIDAFSAIDPQGPIHIHAAEQRSEVEECLDEFGVRPVAFLLERIGLDARWCVVHATHADAPELHELARSRAVVGLCPTTEANLGDGLFPLRRLLDAGGCFGVGSDSNVCRSPTEELRWLEYGQRLHERRRNVAADAGEPSTGAKLYRAALRGGSRALGRRIGAIAPGRRADVVVLDAQHPALLALDPDSILDGWIFSAGSSSVRDVMVGGRWIVRNGRHSDRETIGEAYGKVVRRLYGA